MSLECEFCGHDEPKDLVRFWHWRCRDESKCLDRRLDAIRAAALARVRALCEELHDTDEIVTEAYDRLRAAIEGDNP